MNEVFGIKTFTMELNDKKLNCMVQFDGEQEKPLYVIEATTEDGTVLEVSEELEEAILVEALKGE